jgi:hypothetical protein
LSEKASGREREGERERERSQRKKFLCPMTKGEHCAQKYQPKHKKKKQVASKRLKNKDVIR